MSSSVGGASEGDGNQETKTSPNPLEQIFNQSMSRIACSLPQPLLTVLGTIEEYLDDYFECIRHGSTVRKELIYGILNFFSCAYILPVIPSVMYKAGYESVPSYCISALMTGMWTIIFGLMTNTPLVVAPPTAVTIYFISSLRVLGYTPYYGNKVVAYTGAALAIFAILGPLGRFVTKLIPDCIQAATTVGIGLVTTLSGAVDIGLVQQGKYTLLEIGAITPEILIALSGLIVLTCAIISHSQLAYLLGISWGTIIFWSYDNSWPKDWANQPHLRTDHLHSQDSGALGSVTVALVFLNLLVFFGLARALCDLAHLTHEGGAIPKGRSMLLIIGLANLMSSFFHGPPIGLSPEAAGGIKAGARTGLSAIVTGSIFLLSIFFWPVILAIPSAGTAPVLIMIGLLLFQNIKRIDFTNTRVGLPAFLCLFFIPLTNNLIAGVGLGTTAYLILSMYTMDIMTNLHDFKEYYFPDIEEWTSRATSVMRESVRESMASAGDIVNQLKMKKMSTKAATVVFVDAPGLSPETAGADGAVGTGKGGGTQPPPEAPGSLSPSPSPSPMQENPLIDGALAVQRGGGGGGGGVAKQQQGQPQPQPQPQSLFKAKATSDEEAGDDDEDDDEAGDSFPAEPVPAPSLAPRARPAAAGGARRSSLAVGTEQIRRASLAFFQSVGTEVHMESGISSQIL